LNDGCKGGIKLSVSVENLIEAFETPDPLTARSRFISRRPRNIGVIGGMFILCVSALSLFWSILLPGAFLPMLACDVLALSGAYYLYVLWDKRPIRLCCGCEEILLTTTPWVCGVCKRVNRNANEYPFVHRCEHSDCGAEPKAYKCHHCNELIFLTEDEDKTNYAYCLNSPDELPKPDERAEKLKKIKEKKEEKEAVLDSLKVEEELRKKRRALKVEKKKTAKEHLKESVSSRMELEQARDALKASFARKYKGSKLRRMNAALDDCVQRQLAEE
jgi:hypothetical protein